MRTVLLQINNVCISLSWNCIKDAKWTMDIFVLVYYKTSRGAAVAEWLSSLLAEQEDRGSIPGLATWIFRDWLSPASKWRYGWKIAKSTLISKQPTNKTSLRFVDSYQAIPHSYKMQCIYSYNVIIFVSFEFVITRIVLVMKSMIISYAGFCFWR